MKQFLFFISLIFTFQNLNAQVVYDANAALRTVSSFHSIYVDNAFDVYLTQGNAMAVAVSASDSAFNKNIVTKVKDGVLYIWYDNKEINWPKFKTRLTAYISCTELKELKVSGNSDVFITRKLKVNECTIHLSGASDVVGQIEADSLFISLSGASDIKLSGSAIDLKLKASGASDFNGYNFITESCSANLSGASDVKITVNKILNVSANGASDVYFKGNGELNHIKKRGASHIKRIRD